MSQNSWQHPVFADAYARKNDPKDWYEQEVNFPAMLSLLPRERVSLLDLGCGPGEFTERLHTSYDVEGSDISERMIEIAQSRCPHIPFVAWDCVSPFPSKGKRFHAVFSKLVLMFVDDLDTLSRRISEVLEPGGSFVFSVAHPFRTAEKVDGDYFEKRTYETRVGDSDLIATMIHRNIEEYTRPFLENGFTVTSIIEPRITAEQAKKHAVTGDDLRGPKRLLVRLAL